MEENQDEGLSTPAQSKFKVCPTACGSSLWLQIRANLVLNLDTISTGMCMGFTGICLPQLRQDQDLHISESESSLMASLAALGGLTGGLIMAPLAERIARKGSLMLSAVFSILGWLGSALSFHVQLLLCSRFLMGMGMGASTGTRQVLVAELAQVHLRGLLSSINLFGFQLGLFAVYVLGIIFHWRVVCAVGCAVSLAFATGVKFYLPESPRYLIHHDRIIEAEKSLQKVRHGCVQAELESVRCSVNRQSKKTRQSLTPKDFMTLRAFKPFAILFLLTFTARFSGAIGITTFAIDLFPAFGNQDVIDRYLATILTGLFQLLLSVLGAVTVFYLRNRKVLLISGLGMGAGLLLTAVYLHVSPKKGGPVPWLPFVGVWLYLCFAIPGYSVVLRILGGELFPLQLRGVLSNAFTCASYLITFLSAQTFPLLLRELTPSGAFYLFSGVAVGGTTLGYLLTPETSGKTLEEIEESFTTQRLPLKISHDDADKELSPMTLQTTKV